MTDATTTLLASWEEKQEDLGNGSIVVRISSGDPHTRATFFAVVDRYNSVTGRPRPTEEDVQSLMGQKVTLVKHGTNMIGGGIIVAQEGTLLIGSSGLPMILPKRARRNGFRIDYSSLLDVLPGYATARAHELVTKARAHFPKLKAITQERLNEMPSSSELLTLCAFGGYHMPDSVQADALVLYGEYDPENDILDTGVVLLRPEHGVSEHGSMYGQHLLRWNFGEVEGFEPISFREGLELCNLDFDEAYSRVMNQGVLAS